MEAGGRCEGQAKERTRRSPGWSVTSTHFSLRTGVPRLLILAKSINSCCAGRSFPTKGSTRRGTVWATCPPFLQHSSLLELLGRWDTGISDRPRTRRFNRSVSSGTYVPDICLYLTIPSGYFGRGEGTAWLQRGYVYFHAAGSRMYPSASPSFDWAELQALRARGLIQML